MAYFREPKAKHNVAWFAHRQIAATLLADMELHQAAIYESGEPPNEGYCLRRHNGKDYQFWADNGKWCYPQQLQWVPELA